MDLIDDGHVSVAWSVVRIGSKRVGSAREGEEKVKGGEQARITPTRGLNAMHSDGPPAEFGMSTSLEQKVDEWPQLPVRPMVPAVMATRHTAHRKPSIQEGFQKDAC